MLMKYKWDHLIIQFAHFNEQYVYIFASFKSQIGYNYTEIFFTAFFVPVANNTSVSETGSGKTI